MSLAQLLTRRWIGDAIRLSPGEPRELGWFDDGVTRYLATRVLARVGLLAPRDWAGLISDELSVVATAPDGASESAAESAHADADARERLMMRGALYAARESAVIAARTKGERNVETVLAALLERARPTHHGAYAALPAAAWLEELAKYDPDAVKAFDAIVTHGGPISLPRGALGPCFRAASGEYVAFDAGFDLAATRRASVRVGASATIVGLRPGGPASRAGVHEGDVVLALDARDGDAGTPVKLTVSRGDEKVRLEFLPRGRHGRGQTWSRIAGVPDERCGLPP